MTVLCAERSRGSNKHDDSGPDLQVHRSPDIVAEYGTNRDVLGEERPLSRFQTLDADVQDDAAGLIAKKQTGQAPEPQECASQRPTVRIRRAHQDDSGGTMGHPNGTNIDERVRASWIAHREDKTQSPILAAERWFLREYFEVDDHILGGNRLSIWWNGRWRTIAAARDDVAAGPFEEDLGMPSALEDCVQHLVPDDTAIELVRGGQCDSVQGRRPYTERETIPNRNRRSLKPGYVAELSTLPAAALNDIPPNPEFGGRSKCHRLFREIGFFPERTRAEPDEPDAACCEKSMTPPHVRNLS